MTLRAGASNISVRAWRRYFTLSSIDSVIELMREVFISCGVVFSDEQTGMKYLKNTTINNSEISDIGIDPSVKEPNLAFISIVLGYIENHLTSSTSEDFDSIKLKNPHHRKLVSRRKETLPHNSPRSRSSSFTKSQSPLYVHLETSEEQQSEGRSDHLELNNKLNPFPRSLSSNVFGQETTNQSPVCRRRTRRFGSSRRVRQRNESELSISTPITIESPLSTTTTTAKNEPLQILTDIPVRKRRRFSDSTIPNSAFPCLTFDELERLYLDFYNLIANSPKLKPFLITDTLNGTNGTESKYQKSHTTTTSTSRTTSTKKYACRTLICVICEVLWSQMTASRFKERLTHTQSVYSFLTTGILDSFGLAYTVVAACQLLGYSDVDLALSEDHGWVEFGPPESRQTADVASWVQEPHTSTSSHNSELSSSHDDLVQPTEHSRIRKTSSSTEDEHNPPSIRIPPLEHSWLYVSGYPVVCRPRIMAVAAAIAAIQPGASLSAVTQAPTSEPFAYGTLSPNPSVSSSGGGGGDLITPTGLVKHLSSASVISMQLVTLKHQLLWLCFDAGCLARYPLGLTNLGDLEDAFPTMGRLATFLNSLHSTPKLNRQLSNEFNTLLINHHHHHHSNHSNHSLFGSPSSTPTNTNTTSSTTTTTTTTNAASNLNSHIIQQSDWPYSQLPETVSLALALYNRAILVNQYYYSNYHVYPYTCLAGCLYRHGDNRGALRHWAEASKVIGHYNHTSEDWEIYRELLEIATHLMPQMFRSASENSHFCSEGLVDTDPDGCLYQPDNILDDPHCLSYLLSFYDHLCLWEEGSPVPVLHVGWVDKLMVNLSRFTQRARRHLSLSVACDKDENNKNDFVHSPALTHSTCRSSRWTTESIDTTITTTTTSETGFMNMHSAKRTRRHHRSGQLDTTTTTTTSLNISTPIVNKTTNNDLLLKINNDEDNDDVNIKLEQINDIDIEQNHIQSPSSTITTNHEITCDELASTTITKVSNEKNDMLQTDLLVESNQDCKPSYPIKSCQTSITVEIIPEELSSNTRISMEESYSPNHTKSTPPPPPPAPPTPSTLSTHTNTLFDDILQSDSMDPTVLLDTEEQDGSPSPLMDFPNHDDLLASLVEACDHRLLNPAFLWGMEPHSPFLPANIAPEEALNRLMIVLEENKSTSTTTNTTTNATVLQQHNSNDDTCTETMIHHHPHHQQQQQHIFPTPPNSGSFTGSLENIVHEESTPPPPPPPPTTTTVLSSHTTVCCRSPPSQAADAAAVTTTHEIDKVTQPPPPTATTIMTTESDSQQQHSKINVLLSTTEEHTLFSNHFDMVDDVCNNSHDNNNAVVSSDDFDLLANIPNELMDSVASLVVGTDHHHHQQQPQQHQQQQQQIDHQINSPTTTSTDFFNLFLESENSFDKTLCNHHPDHHRGDDDDDDDDSSSNNNNDDDIITQLSTNYRPMKTMQELTVHLSLYSVKMASIIELLRAPRLNSSAIKLALTAQSQVCVRRSTSSSVHSNYF
ncbi:unnamed protein product [Schistosoma turkestanicum]|nr:unnamed protein product [Schistosoma turkestanicum]